MENLNNSIKIFSLTNDIYTLIDIKTIYRKLASDNHHDKGGNTETMQLINNAFENFCNYFANNQVLNIQNVTSEQVFNFEFIKDLKTMLGITIEICGEWVWVSGNTYQYKDQIAALGFKYSKTKKSWYWAATLKATYWRGNKNMGQIRAQYGSQKVNTTMANQLG